MPSSNFSVTITKKDGSAPSDGSVDPVRLEQYFTKNSQDVPTTRVQAVAKERANARWSLVEAKLQTLGNIYIKDRVATAGSATAAPTSVTFTAIVEHGAISLSTPDENNAGTVLTGAAAIKRAIARALVVEFKTIGDFPNPERPRSGQIPEEITVGALYTTISAAEVGITVTAE